MKTLEQVVTEARRPDRFLFKDVVSNIFNDFIELHGDRIGHDDSSISTGLATIENINLLVVGINKGSTSEENITYNFGSPRPNGYRKVTRVINLANKFELPVLTFINTPGAAASVNDEYDGQSTAIGELISLFGSVTVPTIAIFTGEGESGGALALANTDKIIMLENSIFSVASPEAFSSILFKKSSDVQWDELEKLPMTANDLFNVGICDEVIEEKDKQLTDVYQSIKLSIVGQLHKLEKLSAEERFVMKQKKLDEITKCD